MLIPSGWFVCSSQQWELAVNKHLSVGRITSPSIRYDQPNKHCFSSFSFHPHIFPCDIRRGVKCGSCIWKNIAVVRETEKAGSLCNTQASAAVFSRKKWNLIFIESSFFCQPKQRLYYKNAESVLLQKNWFHIPHNSGLFSAPASTATCFHTHAYNPLLLCSYTVYFHSLQWW